MNVKKLFSGRVSSVILALIVCALWGTLFPFIKIGYSTFHISSNNIPSIILFAGTRFTVSGIIMIALFSATKRKFLKPKKSDILPILAVAAFTIILHYFFTYMALAIGEGSKTAIIKQIGFLFLSCFSFLFIKTDRFTWKNIICGILGFLGIIVTNLNGGAFTFALGDALLIIASFCSVAGTIVTKKAVKKTDPLTLVAYSQFFGGIFLVILGLTLGGRIPHVDIKSIGSLAYICFASISAYVIWNVLIKYNSLSKLSIIKFTEPLFAVIFSGLLLGESIFRLNYLFAFIIILASILISNVNMKSPKNDLGD